MAPPRRGIFRDMKLHRRAAARVAFDTQSTAMLRYKFLRQRQFESQGLNIIPHPIDPTVASVFAIDLAKRSVAALFLQ